MLDPLKRLKLSPAMVRLMATKGQGRCHKAMTHDDVAVRAGMSKRSILELSKKTNWSNVTMGTMSRFCLACNVDPFSDRIVKKAMRRSKLSYQLKAPPIQRKMFGRIMKAEIAAKSVSA